MQLEVLSAMRPSMLESPDGAGYPTCTMRVTCSFLQKVLLIH